METVKITFLNDVLFIENNVIDYFESINQAAETGGILIGYKLFERNEYVLSAYTKQQMDDNARFCDFERNSSKHFEILKSMWKENESLMYFGDWHFHPVDYVSPSSTDLKTFKKLCKNSVTSSKYMIFIIVAKKQFRVFIYDKKSARLLHDEKVEYVKEL